LKKSQDFFSPSPKNQALPWFSAGSQPRAKKTNLQAGLCGFGPKRPPKPASRAHLGRFSKNSGIIKLLPETLRQLYNYNLYFNLL
jgi:hypothetical protein